VSQEEQKARRKYSAELKLGAVKRALAGEPVVAIAEELGIRRKFIYSWKDCYLQLGEAGLARGAGRPLSTAAKPCEAAEAQGARGELLAARKRIAELERKVGQQALELDFFGEALRRVDKVDAKSSTKRSAR
jgi:transposase